jgi:hypothetical protein
VDATLTKKLRVVPKMVPFWLERGRFSVGSGVFASIKAMRFIQRSLILHANNEGKRNAALWHVGYGGLTVHGSSD